MYYESQWGPKSYWRSFHGPKQKSERAETVLKMNYRINFFGFIMPWGFQIHCMAFDQMKIWRRSINTLRSSPKNVLPLVLHWTNTLSTTLLMPTHFGTDLLPVYCTPFLCVHEKSSLLLMKPLPLYSSLPFFFITGNETLSDSILLGNIYAVCCV